MQPENSQQGEDEKAQNAIVQEKAEQPPHEQQSACSANFIAGPVASGNLGPVKTPALRRSLIFWVVMIVVLLTVGACWYLLKNLTIPSRKNSIINASLSPSPIASPTLTSTLIDVSGVGIGRSVVFTAHGKWAMQWSFKCTGAQSQNGFSAGALFPDGLPVDENAPVITHGASGSGIANYSRPGKFYLATNTECSWHLVAKE